MPAVSTLHIRTLLTPRASDAASNASSPGIEVVCAWPVSSQYGPGSRVLYYILIVTCVFARKADWLRNACVGLALLLPVVAALHGLVLAATHVPGAVDMDIYGAFQLCAIGVLAAPVAVRHSSTYFNDPGRNVIFVWTLVLLSGLVSLAVEFYRTGTTRCRTDDFGNPIYSIQSFPYNNAQCGFQACSSEDGPFSPIRGGAANNIYIIPAPDRLTFNVATLLAAACCIPAILLLVSMWFKILESIWKSSHTDGRSRSRRPSIMPMEDGERSMEVPVRIVTVEQSEKSNGNHPSEHEEQVTIRKDNDQHHGENATQSQREEQQVSSSPSPTINPIASFVRSYGEITIFSLTILIILILGERNLFSPQVRYQQEPLGNIGQWSPLAGTILAILGSLYLLLTEAITAEKSSPGGAGLSRKSARGAMRISEWFASLARKVFDDSDFRKGQATTYPEVPGERQRNPGLGDTISIYSPSVYAPSVHSPSGRRESEGSDSESGRPEGMLSRSRSNTLEIVRTETEDKTGSKRRDTLEVVRTAMEEGKRPAKRRDTLEVPTSASPGQKESSSVQGGSPNRSVPASGSSSSGERISTPIIVVSPSSVQISERTAQSRRHTIESTMKSERPVVKRNEEG